MSAPLLPSLSAHLEAPSHEKGEGSCVSPSAPNPLPEGASMDELFFSVLTPRLAVILIAFSSEDQHIWVQSQHTLQQKGMYIRQHVERCAAGKSQNADPAFHLENLQNTVIQSGYAWVQISQLQTLEDIPVRRPRRLEGDSSPFVPARDDRHWARVYAVLRAGGLYLYARKQGFLAGWAQPVMALPFDWSQQQQEQTCVIKPLHPDVVEALLEVDEVQTVFDSMDRKKLALGTGQRLNEALRDLKPKLIKLMQTHQQVTDEIINKFNFLSVEIPRVTNGTLAEMFKEKKNQRKEGQAPQQ